MLVLFFVFIFPTLIPKRFCHVLKCRALFCFPHTLLFYFFFLFYPQEPLDLIFSGQIGYDCDRPLPNVYSHFVTQLLFTKELVESACVF